MRRLHPDPAPVPPEEAYAELGLAERAEALTRPYVVANMISTADGRASLGGRTKGISNDSDRVLFHSLREQVDAVMVGTSTIAIERYGPLVRDDARRARRAERGLERVPLAVTVSRSLELPVTAPLFQDQESRIVVLAGASGEPPEAEAEVIVERVPAPDGTSIDLVAGLERLRERYDVRTVLLEGGPTLLGLVLEAGLVDEFFLALAPFVVGDVSEPALVEGPPLEKPARMELLSVFEDESYLFLRYAVGA